MKHLRTFEENSNLEYTITGIKCDNCDWSDMSFTWDDLEQIKKDWLNKPCPKCGSNLLTKKDFDEVANMTNAVEKTNQLTEEEIQQMIANLSPDEMDQVLDLMNSMQLKKTDNQDGTETWTSTK